MSIACCLLTVHLREESNSVFSTLFYYLVWQSLLKSEHTQVPELVHHVLQSSTPPLGFLQYASFSLLLGHPRFDTVLPGWSQKGWTERSHHLAQLDYYSLANPAQYVVGLFCCMGSLVTQFQESWGRRNIYLFQAEFSGVLSNPMCTVKGANNSREGKWIVLTTSRPQPPNLWDDQILKRWGNTHYKVNYFKKGLGRLLLLFSPLPKGSLEHLCLLFLACLRPWLVATMNAGWGYSVKLICKSKSSLSVPCIYSIHSTG